MVGVGQLTIKLNAPQMHQLGQDVKVVRGQRVQVKIKIVHAMDWSDLGYCREWEFHVPPTVPCSNFFSPVSPGGVFVKIFNKN